jgi:hypothetical protein
MEHSGHLMAKHLVEAITSHFQHNGITESISKDEPASDGGEDDNDHDEVFAAGDSLGKVIALVKQVSNITIVMICLLCILATVL